MPKTKPIPWSKEEIDALLKASEENEFYYTLFLVAKTTGRRLGEYYSLRVGDIDFDKGLMRMIVTKTRTYSEKDAVLTPDTARILKQYITRNKLKPEDFVFRLKTKRAIQKAIVRYGRMSGVNKKVSFHNFRHYFITEFIRHGWNFEKIAKLTGHKSYATLAHYDHVLTEEIKEDALDALKNL